MDNNKQDLIDRYIRKELSEEELSHVKEILEEEHEASEYSELLSNTRRRLGARAMKDKLIAWGFTEEEKFLKKESKKNQNIKLWVGLSAAACLALFILINVPTDNSAIDQFDNYNQSSFEKTTVIDTLQNETDLHDSISPSKDLTDSLRLYENM